MSTQDTEIDSFWLWLDRTDPDRGRGRLGRFRLKGLPNPCILRVPFASST
jgi:hypothetical protein